MSGPRAYAIGQDELQTRLNKLHHQKDLIVSVLDHLLKRMDLMVAHVNSLTNLNQFLRYFMDASSTMELMYMKLFKIHVLLTEDTYVDAEQQRVPHMAITYSFHASGDQSSNSQLALIEAKDSLNCLPSSSQHPSSATPRLPICDEVLGRQTSAASFALPQETAAAISSLTAAYARLASGSSLAAPTFDSSGRPPTMAANRSVTPCSEMYVTAMPAATVHAPAVPALAVPAPPVPAPAVSAPVVLPIGLSPNCSTTPYSEAYAVAPTAVAYGSAMPPPSLAPYFSTTLYSEAYAAAMPGSVIPSPALPGPAAPGPATPGHVPGPTTPVIVTTPLTSTQAPTVAPTVHQPSAEAAGAASGESVGFVSLDQGDASSYEEEGDQTNWSKLGQRVSARNIPPAPVLPAQSQGVPNRVVSDNAAAMPNVTQQKPPESASSPCTSAAAQPPSKPKPLGVPLPNADVVGTTQDIVLSFYKTPSEFWIQLTASAGILETLLKRLQEHYSNSARRREFTARAGMYCAAYYVDDGHWYRARILQVKPDHAKVFYVDFGNVDRVEIDCVCFLEEQFASLPAQGLCCSIKGVKSPCGPGMWTMTAVRTFRDKISRQGIKLQAYFHSQDIVTGRYIVDILSDNHDHVTINLSQEFLNVCSTEVPLLLKNQQDSNFTTELPVTHHVVTVSQATTSPASTVTAVTSSTNMPLVGTTPATTTSVHMPLPGMPTGSALPTSVLPPGMFSADMPTVSIASSSTLPCNTPPTTPSTGMAPPPAGMSPPPADMASAPSSMVPPSAGMATRPTSKATPSADMAPPPAGMVPPPTGTAPPPASMTPAPPAGTAPPNAGTAPPDAGTAPPDAGTAPPDAGTAPPDAGTALPDAGTALPDAGTALPDAGTAPPDAGTAPPDAGTAPPDAGTAPPDAGTTPPNAGTAPAPTVTSPAPAGMVPPQKPVATVPPATITPNVMSSAAPSIFLTAVAPAAMAPAAGPPGGTQSLVVRPTTAALPPVTVPPAVLPEGDTFCVVLSVVFNPSDFYGQIVDHANPTAKVLEDLQHKLNVCANQSEPPEEEMVTKGSFWICSFSGDKNWYRVRVLDVLQGPPCRRFRVLYLDYGNRSTLLCSDLRPLPPELTRLPACAHRMSLAYVGPRGNKWDGTAIDAFVKETGFHALLIAEKKGRRRTGYEDITEVVLWNRNGPAAVNVNVVLVERDLALLRVTE